jgi:hypothetical protein
MWSVLENTVRSRFPPPSSVKQLEDVLHVQQYNVPLENIQNLHESIPSRIQAVLQANVGLTLYFKKRNVHLSELFPLFCPCPVYFWTVEKISTA